MFVNTIVQVLQLAKQIPFCRKSGTLPPSYFSTSLILNYQHNSTMQHSNRKVIGLKYSTRLDLSFANRISYAARLCPLCRCERRHLDSPWTNDQKAQNRYNCFYVRYNTKGSSKDIEKYAEGEPYRVANWSPYNWAPLEYYKGDRDYSIAHDRMSSLLISRRNRRFYTRSI